VPHEKPSRRVRIPRRTCLIIGLPAVLIVYSLVLGLLPWAMSLVAPRLGWSQTGPSALNVLGLFTVAAGAVGLIWVFSVMLAQLPKLPEVVELDEGERLWSATSRVLITHGPFAFSRNPMFLCGLICLLGWALFYGSILIFVAALAGWTFSNFLKVPQEERGLEARFGDEYRTYKARVPRWIGHPKRR